MTQLPKDMVLKMIPGAKEKMLDNFSNDGYVSPILFLNLDGELAIMPQIMFPTKDHVVAALEQMILRGNLKEFVMVGEAWTSDDENAMQWMRDGNSLADFAGSKKEVIHYHYSSPTKEMAGMAEIIRNGEDANIGKWDEGEIKQSDIPATLLHRVRYNHLWTRAKGATN